MHILLVRTSGLLSQQRVIGASIRERWIQIFTVNVAGKRPRLPHQPADDVPVVDLMLVLAAQAWQALHQLLGIPDLNLVHADPRLHLLADQPRRHGVGVLFHPDGAAATHTHTLALQRVQTPLRQSPQVRHLFRHLRRPATILLPEHAEGELPVLCAAGKIPAATQQQRLLHGVLEMPMQRFHISILMPTGGIGRLGLHTVMRQ